MADKKEIQSDFIKFLGTAGARFVMIKQLRASGGIWINSNGTNALIDPGPGSIVRCAASRPKMDPSKLDAIILTHCHLDHSNDINVMIEAMTEGGFKKKGVVFCSKDAVARQGSVIFDYARALPEKIEILEAQKKYKAGALQFSTSMRHLHSAETYGIKFKIKGTSVSLLADTKYFRELTRFYKTDILIVNVVFYDARPEVEHLSIDDAERLIKDIRPKKAILTHFGMSMLKANPYKVAERLSQKIGIEVSAAYDGMKLAF
jgi:phosphoribosyl 1,2-cyclic phosphodiesterase